MFYGVLGATPFVGAVAGLPFFPPVLFAAFRIDVGAVLLLLLVAIRADYWYPKTPGDIAGVLVTGLLTLGVNIALVFAGQQYVTSATGAVIYSLAPLITAVFAFFLIPAERLDSLGGLGITLGFVGAVIVADPNPSNLMTATNRGVGLVLLSVTSFGIGNVLTRRIDPELPSLTLTAWGLGVAAVFVHGVSLLRGETIAQVEWTTPAVLSLVGVGVLATAVLYRVHFELLESIGATKTNLAYYAHPISTAIAGNILLDERITVFTVVGFAVIFVGFVLIERQTVLTGLSAIRSK
ncbi:DMT family transporter [Halomicroarcula sp. F13]|uniref:DMT family transporter n=1 Tax=Haloarcula rubra TaxID=2487747 RepID=A0AAW4PUS8_9EURY|nr:DMT family transporter [Halomicroarcula rubra]MBX0324376.1 DMT family transporter [Halomicroarcula rubra]